MTTSFSGVLNTYLTAKEIFYERFYIFVSSDESWKVLGNGFRLPLKSVYELTNRRFGWSKDQAKVFISLWKQSGWTEIYNKHYLLLHEKNGGAVK